MNITELLLRKRQLEAKLAITNKYLDFISNSSTDIQPKLTSAIKYKFELLSKIRSHEVLLDRLNTETTILVGGIEISVKEALYLMHTLELKIATFNNLVKSPSAINIDVLDIMSKIDALFEEYLSIYKAVKHSDSLLDLSGKE